MPLDLFSDSHKEGKNNRSRAFHSIRILESRAVQGFRSAEKKRKNNQFFISQVIRYRRANSRFCSKKCFPPGPQPGLGNGLPGRGENRDKKKKVLFGRPGTARPGEGVPPFGGSGQGGSPGEALGGRGGGPSGRGPCGGGR